LVLGNFREHVMKNEQSIFLSTVRASNEVFFHPVQR